MLKICIISTAFLLGMLLAGWTVYLFNKNRLLKKARDNLDDYSAESFRQRQAEALYLYRSGNEQKGFLYSIDKMMIESGIYRKSHVSAEIYLLILAVTGFMAGGLLTFIYKHNFFVFLLGFIAAAGIIQLIVYRLSARNYLKAEAQLMVFLDSIDSYARTSDDIVDIFQKVYVNLDEPLKTAVQECFTEANVTGDISTAFYNLSMKIPHAKFQEIISSLDICRRHEANYSQILGEMRESLNEYIFAKKERKSLRNESRVSMAIILAVGYLVCWMMGSFVEGGNVFRALLQNAAGIGILLYIAVLAMLLVVSLIRIDRK